MVSGKLSGLPLVLLTLLTAALPPSLNAFQFDGIYPGSFHPPEATTRDDYWEIWWYVHRRELVPLSTHLSYPSPDSSRRVTDDQMESVLQALDAAAKDKEVDVRVAARLALAKAGNDGVVPRLIEAAQADRGNLKDRAYSILALGVLGKDEAPVTNGDPVQIASYLDGVLHDKQTEVELKSWAALSLGLIDGPVARARMGRALGVESFREQDSMLQSSLAMAAGISRNPELLTPLLGLWNSRKLKLDHSIRANVLLSLSQCARPGNEDVRELLEDSLRDEVDLVRRAAAMGLGTLLEGTADRPAVKRIGQILRGDREPVELTRCLDYLAIARIGGKDAALYAFNRIKNPPLVPDAEDCYAALALGLSLEESNSGLSRLVWRFDKAAHIRTRGAFAIGLGLLGSPHGAKVVRDEFRKEDNAQIASHEAIALGLMKDEKARPLLEGKLKSTSNDELILNTAIALAMINAREGALQILLDRLRVPADETRQALLLALGAIGDQTVVPAIVAILNGNDSARVRRFAAVALGQLIDPSAAPVLSRIADSFLFASQSDHFTQPQSAGQNRLMVSLLMVL